MQKNFRLILLLTAFILTFLTGYAQEKNNNDGNYISGTDYAHAHDKKEVRREEEERPEANVIKFSMLSWISGCIPFYYERRVTPWMSLQFGLGLTTRDFIADGVTYIVDGLGSAPQNYNNYAFYGSQGRKSSIGAYASFQPKFYPGRRALAGFYVSPMVEFKRFDFTAENVDPTAVSDDEQPVYLSSKIKEYRNAVDFTVNIGRQWLLPSKVSLEIMGGVGFRKLWEQRRFITESDAYNPATGYSGYSFTNTTTWSNTYRPEFNLSFIIGGYF
jgi:hypothetical protein